MTEWLRILRSRIRALLKRRDLDRELQEELQFHLREKQSAMEASGVGTEEARSAVERRFGNEILLRESCREAWMFRGIENSFRDARYAVRMLGKNRTFTIIAVVTLAFGIGANTAIFSVIDSVVMRALPYKDPGRLYAIREAVQDGPKRFQFTCVNAGNFLLWTPHANSFTGMALLEPTTDNLNLKDETIQIHGVRASADLFTILGITPRVGRSFTREEDRSGKASSIILTDSLWKKAFRADPAIIGSTVHLNGFPLVVAGVLPESFYFPKQNQLYPKQIAAWTHPIEYFVNLGLSRGEMQPGLRMFDFAVIARLQPEGNPRRAAQELDAGEAQAGKGLPAGAQLQIDLVPLKTSIIGPIEHNLWTLFVAAMLVLLLVCVNLAGLLIAKGAGRAHEVGVRISLGARRLDIVRQFVIEALLLSVAGGTVGVLAAYWGVRALVKAAPVEIPRLQSIGLDARVLFFSAAVSIGAGIFFSLLPALRLSRTGSSGAMKAVGPTTTSSRPISRFHKAIAASEIALCTVLLVSALLIAQSLMHVLKTNAWADASRVITLNFTAPANRYLQDSKRTLLYTKLLDSARNYPGVETVGLTNALPFKGEMWGDTVEFVEDPKTEKDAPNANWRMISPDYFRAIGLRLVSGRHLLKSDFGRHLILISERLARQLPAGINPVGVHIAWTPPSSRTKVRYEVIGVIADARATPDEEAPFTVYVPYWESPPWEAVLVVQTKADERAVSAGIERLVRSTDNEIAIPTAETMHDILSKAVAPRRFVTLLVLLFAATATFLAALGLYGLIALAVSQRTREIGVRIAVGAQAAQIFRMLILEALALASAWLACGIGSAWAATRLLRSFLYEIKPGDPLTFAAVTAALLAVSIAASYLPARRATRVDPVRALKWE